MVFDDPPAPPRRRLVDYSDSDSEDEDDEVIDAPPQPAPGATSVDGGVSPPETENELAKIVVELQNKYIREVEDIGEKQEQWKREMQGWKSMFEEKWVLERKLLRGLIKHAYKIDVEQFLAQEGSGPPPDLGIEAQAPPSPSASASTTPSALAPATGSSSPNGSQTLNPTLQGGSGLATSEREGLTHKTSTEAPSVPQRTRSTGKKAPRPNVAANRRPYQPQRKPTAAKSKPTKKSDDTNSVQVAYDLDPSKASEKQPDVLALPSATPQEPREEPENPYDAPKNFSSMTGIGKDGVQRPIFRFHKHPDTVEEQWAEWKYGLHGQPPVEQLEAKYRAKWRSEAYGRSWFTRRKAFWDKMRHMMSEGRTEEQALNVMRDLAEKKGSVPGLVGMLIQERGGKGKTLSSKRRRQGTSLLGKRLRESSQELTESDLGVDDEDEQAGRISSAVRKRIKLIEIGGVHAESDAESLSSVEDDDGEWRG